MTEGATPSLLRKARITFSKENYEEAAELYARILQDPEMHDHLDLKTRYAFCIEKTGNLVDAIDVYQEIVTLYKGAGETGAAKATELKISILQKLASGSSGEEIAEDIANLSLLTQELEPMVSGDSGLNAQEDDISGTLSECSDQTVITQQDLIPVEKEAPDPEINQIAADPEAEQKSKEAVRQVEEDDEDLDKLSMMIRKGIHKNVSRKRFGDASGDIELSQLKGYKASNLQLENAEYLEPGKSAKESDQDKKLKEKAAKIFGETKRKF